MTLRSDYKSIVGTLKTKLGRTKQESQANPAEDAEFHKKLNFNYELLDVFSAYFDSGRRAHLFFAENDAITLDFETHFQNGIGKDLFEKYEKCWEKLVIKDSNHSFTNADWRDQLFKSILTCIKKEVTISK